MSSRGNPESLQMIFDKQYFMNDTPLGWPSVKACRGCVSRIRHQWEKRSAYLEGDDCNLNIVLDPVCCYVHRNILSLLLKYDPIKNRMIGTVFTAVPSGPDLERMLEAAHHQSFAEEFARMRFDAPRPRDLVTDRAFNVVAGPSRSVRNRFSDQCYVCHCKMRPSQRVIRLRCKHKFHLACGTLSMNQLFCPTCRYPIKFQLMHHRAGEPDFVDRPCLGSPST